jgi:hypothetical protein
MKKLKLIILIFAFLLFQVNFKSFAGESLDFSLKKPVTWETKDEYNNKVIQMMIFSPLENKSDNFRENISVAREIAPGLDLNQYSNLSIKGLVKLIKSAKFLSQESKVINANKANIIIYTYYNKEAGMDLKIKQYIFYKNGNGYIITCTAPTANFEKFSGTFDQVAQSFKLK